MTGLRAAAVAVCLAVPCCRANAEGPPPAAPGWGDAAWLSADAALILGLKAWAPGARRDVDPAPFDGPRLDAWAIEWGRSDTALTTSDVGVGLAAAWAVGHSVYTGRARGAGSGLGRGVTYAESALTTLALAEVAKQAARRPRPCTYQGPRRLEPRLGCRDTDADAHLSFFSGHTATAATLSATAAFWAIQDGDTAQAAATLGLGAALTLAVAVERVRAGKHFPTDVLTGALVGATVGTLTPYLRGHAAAQGGSVTPAQVALRGAF